jgi:hypothetical protein
MRALTLDRLPQRAGAKRSVLPKGEGRALAAPFGLSRAGEDYQTTLVAGAQNPRCAHVRYSS